MIEKKGKTRYQELTDKADLCLAAAQRTTGFMKKVWIQHSNELRTQADNMPLIKAVQQ